MRSHLPDAAEALLGVVLAGGGELDPLPEEPRRVVPLHDLQRPRPRKRPHKPRHLSPVALCARGGGRRRGALRE